jgi:hypothetical protein
MMITHQPLFNLVNYLSNNEEIITGGARGTPRPHQCEVSSEEIF